jgi:predicted nucleotidyltransferase component of viral defense system
MKDHLAQLVGTGVDSGPGRNLVREYLQARILESLQRAGAMIPLAFHGGTALRFLYGIPRYSEDLDFALERDAERYDLRGYLRTIRSVLEAEAYLIDLRVSDRRIVHSAFVRFPGLLHELGLSPHPDEVFSVKVEVDTRPPEGAGLATTLVRRHVTLHLQHHDRASLLAGKLHALLQRPFLKGRDVYDLLWYLSDPTWPAPSLTLLANALRQTGWTGPEPTERNWRDLIADRLASGHWDRVIADVRPFVESRTELDLLSRENLQRVLAVAR